MSLPEQPNDQNKALQSLRVLIIGLVVVIVVLGLALVAMTTARSTGPLAVQPERVNALANSTDSCVQCHKNNTPGIIQQYGHSTMAAADVSCSDCHEVNQDYPGAVEHEGTFVLAEPTPAMCQRCHQNEVAEFNASRHGAPAYAAIWGSEHFTDAQLQLYSAISEGSFDPDKSRNAIFDIEGPAVTKFACQVCHNIGRPQPDGSIGECQQCHLRHEFSLEQVRKPETCNACHIGPDHPQWEIYQESPHGIAYMTGGHHWNWEAEAGMLDTEDFIAPTCATCHFSGFGGTGTTHDVGERLTWYLFAPISDRRPSWENNLTRMQSVCRECHNNMFIENFYNNADQVVYQVNDWVQESRDILQPLKDNGLLTDAQFDEPVDFTFFEIWHHWGRTTKFGTWMQGADYAQWHGAYELLRDMAKLKQEVNDKLVEAGYEPIDFPPTVASEDY